MNAPRRWTAGLAAAVFGLAACSSGPATEVATVPPPSRPPDTIATTTTAKPAPAAAPKPPLPGIGQGARGPEVQAIEQRLGELKYDAGKVDGVFDATLHHAVVAFQKVHGLARTGRVTPDVSERLRTAGPPDPLLPAGGANRVEVDLKRQVLFLYTGGSLNRVLSVSTGSGKRYCVDGDCAVAVTPGGSFRVNHRIRGWRVSRLGKLYNPLYFNGGIAIHGAPSVPAYPASHGCVRIPMSAAGWFPGAVPNGTPVYVVGGPKAPVPFNEPAPNGTPPASTSTSAPPSSTTTAPQPTTTTAPSTTTTTSPPESTTTTVAPG